MKVKELVEKLSEFDENWDVVIGGECVVTCYSLFEIESGRLDSGYFNNTSQVEHNAVRLQ